MTNSDARFSAESCELRWARPIGNTFDEMRANVWKTGLADIGDTIMIWVNEGDLWQSLLNGVELKEYKSSDGEPSNGKQPLMASRPAPPVPSDPQCSAGNDYVTVPVVPTETMWGGLARDIIMWTRFDRPSQRSLLKHLTSVGTQIPDWLAAECRDIDHVPPKGSVAAWVYRAMLDARPLNQPQTSQYSITQDQIDRLHGAAHSGAMLGGDAAYNGCLKVEAILAEITSALSRPHGHSRFCAIHTVGDCTCTLASHQRSGAARE